MQVCDYISIELEEVREVFDRELQSDLPIVADMLEEVSKFRGKMLRPVLVLLCGKAYGQVNDSHRIIAAVMEMVHMATLVHDDVLDEAESRRRGQTINSLHGNEAAVILGDLLFSHAFHLCSSLDQQLASRIVAATSINVCEGELMQLYYRGFHELTEDRYIEIISRKTASLIASCCYLGGHASGADEETCRSLEFFGWNLGVAFQIMDDITDLTGTESVAGKTLGTDLLKEKMTLPIIHYLDQCSEPDRQWAIAILKDQKENDYLDLIEKLVSSGSIDYARATALQYVKKSQKDLPTLPDSQTTDVLRELSHLVIA